MSFAKWGSATLGCQIIGLFCAAIRGMIIAHILGPEGNGIVTLTLLYPELFFNLFYLSLPASYVHYIGKGGYKIGNFGANSLLFTGILGGLSILFFIPTFIFFKEWFYPGMKGVYLLVTMPLTPFIMTIYYFSAILQGTYNIRDYNLVFLLWKILGMLLVVALVFILKLEVWGAIIGGGLAIIFSGILGIYLVSRITKKEKWQINFSLLKETLKDGLKLHIGCIASFLRSRVNLFLINYYLSVKDVGLFSVSLAISELLLLIPYSTSTVLWPKVASCDEKEARRLTALVCRHTLLLAIVGGIIIGIGAKFFVLIFGGRQFLPAIPSLIILIPGMVIYSIGQSVNGLVIRHKKFLLASYISLFLTFVNIMACIILIPHYKLMGAALSTLLTNVLMCISGMFFFSLLGKGNIKELFIFTKEDLLLYKDLLKRCMGKLKHLS
ncbi:MAG: oligosaccharide flippase family protein [bacterium]